MKPFRSHAVLLSFLFLLGVASGVFLVKLANGLKHLEALHLIAFTNRCTIAAFVLALGVTLLLRFRRPRLRLVTISIALAAIGLLLSQGLYVFRLHVGETPHGFVTKSFAGEVALDRAVDALNAILQSSEPNTAVELLDLRTEGRRAEPENVSWAEGDRVEDIFRSLGPIYSCDIDVSVCGNPESKGIIPGDLYRVEVYQEANKPPKHPTD